MLGFLVDFVGEEEVAALEGGGEEEVIDVLRLVQVGVGRLDGEVEVSRVDEVAHVGEAVPKKLRVEQHLAVLPAFRELRQSLLLQVGRYLAVVQEFFRLLLLQRALQLPEEVGGEEGVAELLAGKRKVAGCRNVDKVAAHDVTELRLFPAFQITPLEKQALFPHLASPDRRLRLARVAGQALQDGSQLLSEEQLVFEVDDLVGGVVGEDVPEEGAQQLALNARILLADLQVEHEHEARMPGEVGVVDAVAGHLLLQHAARHHYVPVLEVASRQVGLHLPQRLPIERLYCLQQHLLRHRLRHENALFYHLRPLQQPTASLLLLTLNARGRSALEQSFLWLGSAGLIVGV